MLRTTTFLAALLFGSVAAAQEFPIASKDLNVSGNAGNLLLDSVACDAGAASLTWTSRSAEGYGYGVGVFQIDLTDANGSETGLTITPYVKINGSSNWVVPMPCDSVTDGTCTLTSPGAFSCTQASGCLAGNNPSMGFRMDFLGYPDIKLVVACTAGATADKVTLRGRISAQ